MMCVQMSKLQSANKEDECIICFDYRKMFYTNCNKHYICADCSIKLVNKVCPMCRQ